MLGYFSMMLFRTIAATFVLVLPFCTLKAERVTLRATQHSQVIQNDRADEDNLARLKDIEMVERFARLQLLEPVPVKTDTYYLHAVLSANRYLRPWAKLFLDRISEQYRARFGKPIRVTSLTRTVVYQNSLRKRNRNAASPYGEKRSTHLTGASLDISKKGMRNAEILWVRRVLASLKDKGYLFAVEEFRQPNFHVMIYRNYPEYVEELVTASNSE